MTLIFAVELRAPSSTFDPAVFIRSNVGLFLSRTGQIAGYDGRLTLSQDSAGAHEHRFFRPVAKKLPHGRTQRRGTDLPKAQKE